MKQKIVILSGAGISAESGIQTFRDADGLWEGHDIMEVATPQGWRKNPALVLDFYNQRRKQADSVKPNAAHYALVELEKKYDVRIITQNVDNLHEKAGSKNVIHLHGELFQSRSTLDNKLVYNMTSSELNLGDKCEKGSQLRPNIVWFGEEVPMIETAADIASTADIFIVIGTSLVVYPAAGLVEYAPKKAKVYVVDLNMPQINPRPNLILIEKKATLGMEQIIKDLM